jgi:hypothetical protein
MSAKPHLTNVSIKHPSTGIVLSCQLEAESRASAAGIVAGLLANPNDWRLVADPADLSPRDAWCELMPDNFPTDGQWRVWEHKYSARTMRAAIQVTAKRMKKNVTDGIDFSTLDLVKYASAVMRNIEADNESQQ